MDNLDRICIRETETVLKAIDRLTETRKEILLVVDEDHQLIASITDGDIRRGILGGVRLTEPVDRVMHRKPVVGTRDMGRQELLQLMTDHSIRHVPIVDKNRKLLDLALLTELATLEPLFNVAVIMAGGEGKRLRPFTLDVPKPMLKVGDKPLLELIIRRLYAHGLRRFVISTRYRSDHIENHFKDGRHLNLQISYLAEKKRLGTIGAVSLLKGKVDSPFLVMNGDILTDLDFRQIFQFHQEHKAFMTVCVRSYEVQVPYGVVEIEEVNLRRVIEKPVLPFFINAGIYVLDPAAIDEIPADQYFDVTELISELLKKGRKVVGFPIREYWLDIGQVDDYKKARDEFKLHFTDEE